MAGLQLILVQPPHHRWVLACRIGMFVDPEEDADPADSRGHLRGAIDLDGRVVGATCIHYISEDAVEITMLVTPRWRSAPVSR